MDARKLFIGGKWVDAESGKTFPVLNPATEEQIGAAALADATDVDKAARAAAEAFPAWAAMTISQRAKLLYPLGAGIREAADELIDLEVREHGTPLNLARGFIHGAVDSAEFTVSLGRALMGQVLNAFPDATVYLKRVPIGVCAVITPWNVPLLMMGAMVVPALIAGNTVVLKPASVNSLLGVKFTEVMEKLGLPPGVMNLVTGPGGSVGEAMSSHPLVDMIRFTGASDTGKEIMRVASATAKKSVMELGGNNPVIVCADADVVKAATWQSQRHFGNCSQNCSTPGRYYVHESVYDQFVETFVNEAKKIVVGDPQDEKTTYGPMANKQQFERVLSYIQSAIDEGARIALGGKRIGDKGYFIEPTVVADVTHDMTIAREEIFGPAAPILKFSSEEEVIKLANDSEYGLVAGVWTKDVAKALRFTDQLRTDSVYINMPRIQVPELPWGGNVKQSGVGKDGSMAGLEEFTDLKMVVIQHGS